MITRIESLSSLPVPEDPFTLRIVSAAEAYGLSTAFLDVWQGNGCLFSRMDGVLTIAGKPDPNETEETALFAASCGAGQIFCAPDTARVPTTYNVPLIPCLLLSGTPVSFRQAAGIPHKSPPFPGKAPPAPLR